MSTPNSFNQPTEAEFISEESEQEAPAQLAAAALLPEPMVQLEQQQQKITDLRQQLAIGIGALKQQYLALASQGRDSVLGQIAMKKGQLARAQTPSAQEQITAELAVLQTSLQEFSQPEHYRIHLVMQHGITPAYVRQAQSQVVGEDHKFALAFEPDGSIVFELKSNYHGVISVKVKNSVIQAITNLSDVDATADIQANKQVITRLQQLQDAVEKAGQIMASSSPGDTEAGELFGEDALAPSASLYCANQSNLLQQQILASSICDKLHQASLKTPARSAMAYRPSINDGIMIASRVAPNDLVAIADQRENILKIISIDASLVERIGLPLLGAAMELAKALDIWPDGKILIGYDPEGTIGFLKNKDGERFRRAEQARDGVVVLCDELSKIFTAVQAMIAFAGHWRQIYRLPEQERLAFFLTPSGLDLLKTITNNQVLCCALALLPKEDRFSLFRVPGLALVKLISSDKELGNICELLPQEVHLNLLQMAELPITTSNMLIGVLGRLPPDKRVTWLQSAGLPLANLITTSGILSVVLEQLPPGARVTWLQSAGLNLASLITNGWILILILKHLPKGERVTWLQSAGLPLANRITTGEILGDVLELLPDEKRVTWLQSAGLPLANLITTDKMLGDVLEQLPPDKRVTWLQSAGLPLANLITTDKILDDVLRWLLQEKRVAWLQSAGLPLANLITTGATLSRVLWRLPEDARVTWLQSTGLNLASLIATGNILIDVLEQLPLDKRVTWLQSAGLPLANLITTGATLSSALRQLPLYARVTWLQSVGLPLASLITTGKRLSSVLEQLPPDKRVTWLQSARLPLTNIIAIGATLSSVLEQLPPDKRVTWLQSAGLPLANLITTGKRLNGVLGQLLLDERVTWLQSAGLPLANLITTDKILGDVLWRLPASVRLDFLTWVLSKDGCGVTLTATQLEQVVICLPLQDQGAYRDLIAALARDGQPRPGCK